MSILKFDNYTLDLPNLKHSYDEDGFLVLRGFASATETELLERYVIAARKVRLDELEKQHNKKPEFAALAVKGLQQNCKWLAKQMHEGPHLGLLEFLLGDSVWPVSAALVDRPSGSKEGIYPHIDAAGRPWHPRAGITLWIALDSMDERNGCVSYVKGSHREKQARGLDIQGYEENSERVTTITVNRGDAIIHNALTVHWSGSNLTERPRKAITFFYYGEMAAGKFKVN